MPASFIISVSIFVNSPDDGSQLRVVATGEFQPSDAPEGPDSFILYSYRAYSHGVMVPYEMTDKDRSLVARTALDRGREYLAAGDTGKQLARLGGMSTSPKKAAAARANGARGGRPKKIR